jgi:hypothetical protein
MERKMKAHFWSIVASLFAAVISAPAAHASVAYVFTAYGSVLLNPSLGTLTGTFTYIAPSFITPTETVPAADMASCSATFSVAGAASCVSAEFDFFSPNDRIEFSADVDDTGATVFYYFPSNAFSTPGVYDTNTVPDNLGQLVVVSVPEASTWAMTLIGFVGLAAGARRWKRKGVLLPAAA